MSRIRTIKPEFFSSADVCALTPLARLLYIALWCEADREGRFTYKPTTFKLRYFPADDCDVIELLKELEKMDMIVRYKHDKMDLAYIPAFEKHQVINNRESESSLPSPRVIDATVTRESGVDTRKENEADEEMRTDAPFTRESGVLGEGRKEGRKEGRERARARATQLPTDFVLTDDRRQYIKTKAPNVDPDSEFEKFCNHHRARGSTMKDWDAAWRTWSINAKKWGGDGGGSGEQPPRRSHQRLKGV